MYHDIDKAAGLAFWRVTCVSNLPEDQADAALGHKREDSVQEENYVHGLLSDGCVSGVHPDDVHHAVDYGAQQEKSKRACMNKHGLDAGILATGKRCHDLLNDDCAADNHQQACGDVNQLNSNSGSD